MEDNYFVAFAIKAALQRLPESDRGEFLFALTVADMLRDGWEKERIAMELLKALDIVWENRHWVKVQSNGD